MTDTIRILVIDDHPLLRQGVVSTLNAAADITVVGEGDKYDDAVSLSRLMKPDTVLLDISMPGGGVNAARDIRAEFTSMIIIMLTASEEENDVMSSLKMGANAYILKGVSGSELTEIVRKVSHGESYITPHLATSLLLRSSETNNSTHQDANGLAINLHKREKEILIALQDGMSNKEIAEVLSLSEKTIKHYMSSILQKLHVKNRVEAALFAQKNAIM